MYLFHWWKVYDITSSLEEKRWDPRKHCLILERQVTDYGFLSTFSLGYWGMGESCNNLADISPLMC